MLAAKRKRSRHIIRSLIISAAVLCVSLIRPALIKRAADALQDGIYSALPPRLSRPATCLVFIDRRSIDRDGPWPWDSDSVASLMAAVSRGNPRVVAVAPCFGGRGAKGGPWIRSFGAVGPAAKTVSGYAFSFSRGAPPVPAGLIESSRIKFIANPWGEVRDYRAPRAAGIECLCRMGGERTSSSGFGNIIPGADGVVRALPLVARADGNAYQNFAAAVAAAYRGASRVTLKLAGMEVRGLDLGGYFIRTRADGSLPLREYKRGAIPAHSASDVLDGVVPPGAFRGRAVIIGASGGAIAPLYRTRSSERAPAAEIQAIAVENILRGQYLRESPISRLAWVSLVLLLPLGIPLLAPHLRSGAARGILIACLCAVAAGASAAFAWWRSEEVLFFYPVLSVMATWLACGTAP